MPINNITQTISTIPEAAHRGVDIQTQFVIKQEDFQDHLQGTTVTELNTLKDQLNSRIGEINSTTTTMNGYVDTASAGASTATTKAGEASTSASQALTYKNQAGTFATNSSNSATKASQWADNNYNVAVETGKYSAKHWSIVAQNATANKVDKVTSTDNAIVRFDGTTGAVQNSAITIDDSGNIRIGKPSGGVTTVTVVDGVDNTNLVLPESGTVATLSNIHGFKNLIINGRKQVNQSGLTTTNNAYNYDNHYKVGNNWFMFIEGLDIESGSEYTLSWEGIATASYYIGTAGSSTINAQTFTAIANGGTIIPTITSSQFLWIEFASDATGSTYNKVQFEKGTVATPFENRLKGMEENLLQRYVNVFSTNNISYGILAFGSATAGATAAIPFAFKSRMRTVPSFANLYPAVNYILTNGQGNITTAVTSFTLSNASESTCILSITNDGGLTLGQGCNLLSKGSLSTSILFSARP